MAHVNFRYNIIRFIDSGSMGSVFLVEDLLENGSLRALKTIRTDQMNPVMIKTIQDEFSILCQFHHPCIVRVYDYGEVVACNVPELIHQIFFTLEYIEGITLFDATIKRSWNLIAQIIFQLAHTLDYIHRHGLIHFDVKPSNILVTEVSSIPHKLPLVKIIDFGLATHSLESLESPVRGTIEYMAPELTSGAPFDCRVDLYSLGVTLYEIIARRLPFQGKDSLEFLKKNQSEIPEGIDSIVPDTPLEIVNIVMTLLQKNPSDRFEHAHAIGELVKPLLREHAKLEEIVTNIQLMKFVGRSTEVTLLLNKLRQHIRYHQNQMYPEPSTFICIVGEKGIGKSTFITECIRLGRAEGLTIVNLQCSKGTEISIRSLKRMMEELRLIHRARSAMNGVPTNDLDEYCMKNLEWLFNGDPDAQVMNAQSVEKRMALHKSVSEFLTQVSHVQSFIISIDDVHLADEWSSELLMVLGRQTLDSHWSLLMTSDSVDVCKAMMMAEQEKIDFLILEGFHEEAMRELLQMELGESDIPLELVRSVLTAVGNSPRIVKEWLDNLKLALPQVTLDTIGKAAGNIASIGHISPGVDEIYNLRLQSLSKDGKLLLEFLSCSNEPMEIQLLWKVHSFSSLEIILDRLVKQEIVTRVHEGNAFFITHLHYRLSLYNALAAKRRTLHKRIAEGLLQIHHGDIEKWFNQIAYHFKMAGVKERALKFYGKASAYAAQQGNIPGSIECLEEARQLASDRKRSTAIARELAEKYDRIEKYEKAEKLYRELLSESGLDGKKKFQDFISLGTIQIHRGTVEEAQMNFAKASDIATTISQKLVVEEKVMDIDMARGAFKEVKDRARKVIEDISDPEKHPQMSGLYTKLGIVEFYEANYKASADSFLRAYNILKKGGDRSKLIAPLLNMGNVYSAQGKYAEAIDYWKRALRHAKAVGNVHEQAQILNNLGIAEYSQGHYESALGNYSKGITLFTELQHPPGIILCTSNLGEVFLIQCLYEKAIMDWIKCLSFYEGIKDLQGLIETHNHLCQAYLALGDISSAQNHHRQAGQFLEQEGIEIQQAIHYYCAGILNFMEQQYDSAEENIRKAEAIFTTIGEYAFCCRTRLYRSRIRRANQRFEEIRPPLTEAIEIAEKYNFPLLQAEGLCEFGRQTRENPLTQDKPTISYFRDAFHLIEKEIVSEISWQVSFELGKEYIGRGLVSKGKAILHKSKAVLEYLGGQYTEDPLKASFWSSHGRSECLEEIKLLLSH